VLTHATKDETLGAHAARVLLLNSTATPAGEPPALPGRFEGETGMNQKEGLNRRRFLAGVGATGAVGLMASSYDRILGANNRVRVGVIGAGEYGQNLIRWVSSVPDVEVVAVADVYEARHGQARQIIPSVQTYFQHQEVLDRQDIDAVMIAVPLHLHAKLFLDALSAGKDVYLEKTMAYSVEEAKQCRDAARQSDRVVSIGLQHQSSPSLSDVRRLVKEGFLGKLTTVEAWKSRKITWVRNIPADVTPQTVRWEGFLADREFRPFDAHRFINWRLFWDYAGGMVTELWVHQIAFIMRALDLPIPATVYSSGGIYVWKDGREIPDTLNTVMTFPTEELTVSFDGTITNPYHGIGERYLGTDGTIERLLGSTNPTTGKPEDALRYYPNRRDFAPYEGSSKDVNQTTNTTHVANFVECVRTRQQPSGTVEIGYRSAVAVHMANLSHRLKRVVTWDPVTETVI
jgi:predicted dehydrogenase